MSGGSNGNNGKGKIPENLVKKLLNARGINEQLPIATCSSINPDFTSLISNLLDWVSIRDDIKKQIEQKSKNFVSEGSDEIVIKNGPGTSTIEKTLQDITFASGAKKELGNNGMLAQEEFNNDNTKQLEEVKKCTVEELLHRIKNAPKNPLKVTILAKAFYRCAALQEYVKRRANGICEACRSKAPFLTKDGKYFLEVHHIDPLANGGQDTIENTVALCPNCHRQVHYGPEISFHKQP